MNQPDANDRSTAHFWHIRQVDGDPTTPTLIALPRNARTLELMRMPGVNFESAIIVTRNVNLPDAVVAALPGRLASTVIDHPIMGPGAVGAGAVITWAALDDFGLKLVFDRPVQPCAAIGGFDFLPPDQDIIDADDEPSVLFVDGDDSWRDLTDDDIETIRRA